MGNFRLSTKPFDIALSELKNNSPKSIYFLMGEDYFLQKFFVDQLFEKLQRAKPVQKTLLITDDMSSKDILDRLTTLDLFNSMNLFILRNPNGIRGKLRDELIGYCRNTSEDNILVLIQDEFGAKNKMIKDLAAIAEPISVSIPFENEMVKWARLFFEDNGLNNVPKDIIDSIISFGGDSLYHIKNEIDKISVNIDSIENLNKEYIEQFSGWKRKYREYEFFDYLGQRNLKKSIKIGRTLISQDITMSNLLYPLTEFFQELLYIKISNGTKTSFKRFTNLTKSINRKLPNYASKFSSKEVVDTLKRLSNIDTRIKTSKVDDESIITEFLFATIKNG